MILNSNLTSQNGLRLPNNPQRSLSVQHDEEQTQTRFSKNLAGKFFIIGDGTDVYVTFINCKATKDHCNYTTKYHKNVLSVTIYEDQTCLNHLEKALSDNLLALISKIVLILRSANVNQFESPI